MEEKNNKNLTLVLLLAVCVIALSISILINLISIGKISNRINDLSPETSEASEDIQYVLYLGTNDKDTNEPVYSREESKEVAKEVLIRNFGGYTIQEAEGGWIDGDTAYQEYTLVIYLSDTDLDTVHSVCDELIELFHQSSILIHQNQTTTEFYSGR